MKILNPSDIQKILKEKYFYKIYKTIGSHIEFNKTYVLFLFWETNKELSLILEEERFKIKEIIIDCFKKERCYPSIIKDIIIYFDSDENVKKKYKGNYFYATH